MARLTRRNKFNVAPKTERYSVLLKRTFHSKAECRYAEHLYARQLNHEISDLQFQVRVVLKDRVLTTPMIVDFKYFDERLGEWVWDEFKGMETTAWRRQRKAWALLGPGLYRVTKANRRDRVEPYRHELIRPCAPSEGDSE